MKEGCGVILQRKTGALSVHRVRQNRRVGKTEREGLRDAIVRADHVRLDETPWYNRLRESGRAKHLTEGDRVHAHGVNGESRSSHRSESVTD